MQTYLVGGAVRDELLGLEVKDRDWVVVGATPDKMLDRGFKQVGADFPVFLHPGTREEYALARTERKQGHGYHGFSVYSAPDVTLEEDLKRRDLTINAMARSEQGQIIDPFHGRQDIDKRLLRHVSEAFSEDPLRILRTARFAARFQPLGFRVCEETMALMRRMVAYGEVDHLVAERVWQEFQRALHEQEPVAFFEVLRDCGALASLIPELTQEGRFEQAMAALRCSHGEQGSTEERVAALMSPVPKPDCERRMAALKAPNDCQNLACLVAEFIPAIRHPDATGTGLISAENLLSLLDAADLWRRPERFAALLKVLACALPKSDQPTLQLLEQSANCASGVEPRTLMAEGFKGKALGEAIRHERLRRIEQALSHSSN
ncbi:multifunctional CCA tRNA nucleotidyl transferase/2'3'-cyclic phosphodiesterase/2'nucleotidase/phosphatase [Marinobacter sp. F4206]|uniref:multifunctional CCA tRNA nucleotidyl transferase/2'3'-cyclic phosphodiesterase/2'nucleotidase/phosphatase n=1 Tax=Marinobacter sp. F4206 TaxID=2861777 RepID=UPI001C5CCE1C|nr:multifunctional CCA tRNA nucleotidyl transferase/2'3'-cyclic phosphodiesterase/2'nucleotidase/phosphatase [Marinobacter sp. F4206]MBW4934339.1 multifunctional CCA tRNA nucleotidyl transferase/2'3'-cyclic phosphodiesterase/2'nucleotidase/phosphatase [Marinobacter sp. F4206]